jgi:arylsulfatase A-like enzyme
MELDHVVGEILKKIDDLGIADNTIVIFSSDNGAQKSTWPDGGQPARHRWSSVSAFNSGDRV